MVRKVVLSACMAFSFCVSAFSQPANKPFNNFIVLQGSNTVEYQKIFDVPSDSVMTIKKIVKAMLLGSTSCSNVTFDSNYCTGTVDKIYPTYYNGTKELTGFFKIEVKNGRYRLTIDNMILKGSIFDDDLGSIALSDNFSEWIPMAYNILPELDSAFSKLFNIANVSQSNSW